MLLGVSAVRWGPSKRVYIPRYRALMRLQVESTVWSPGSPYFALATPSLTLATLGFAPPPNLTKSNHILSKKYIISYQHPHNKHIHTHILNNNSSYTPHTNPQSWTTYPSLFHILNHSILQSNTLLNNHLIYHLLSHLPLIFIFTIHNILSTSSK